MRLLLLTTIAILNLLIGLYIFRTSPRSPSHRAFGAMASAGAIWSFAVGLAHHSVIDVEVAARMMFVAGVMIPPATALFVEMFRVSHLHLRNRGSQWLIAASLPLAICSASTDWIVESAVRGSDGARLTYGALHPIFGVVALVGFAYSLWLLARTYSQSNGTLKIQAGYLLIALSVPIVLGCATNLIIPLLLKSSAYSQFGPVFSLAMVTMVAHAIIRHRLMDIRVVIRRGAVYAVSVAAAGTFLAVLLLAANLLFGDAQALAPREVVVALVVAVLFQPLKGSIQRAFDRYLYREPYDFQRTLRDASGELAGSIELEILLPRLATIIQKSLRPEHIAIYVTEDEESAYVRQFEASYIDSPPADRQSPDGCHLVAALLRERRPLFRDELTPTTTRDNLDKLISEFDAFRAEVVVPFLHDATLMGFAVIGPKRSGDAFFSDDEDLLVTLANQSAVAVRNAQAHQRVLEVNQYIHNILETIESGVVAAGARGTITLSNRAAEALVGSSTGSLRKQPLGSVPGPLAALIQATADDGQPRSQVELQWPDAAGQIVPLMCSTAPLRGPQGQAAGAVAVFSDVSRIKALEDEKRRAERLANLEAIASGLVHEVRNPLVSLKTFTQLLPERFADPEFRERFVRVGDHALGRVEDLLTRFRTLAAPPRRPLEPVDVMVPLCATLELLGPRLELAQIRLRQVGDTQPRLILGHPLQLGQLFQNLCLNAIEAMENGGELTVRVADLAEAGGTTLLVEISDTGCGVPEDMLESIFNPFVTTKAEGTGLGLAICRTVADTHRATLRARNNLGRPGATFTVEFPVPTERGAQVSA